MFERIKKAFSRPDRNAEEAATPSQLAHGPMSEWAATRGFAMSVLGDGQTVSLRGDVVGRPWRLEVGRSTRPYIRGEELRARAEMALDDELAVMVINRPLKEVLEKKAYSMITDTLRTTADPNLPEEMRWLAMYQEVGWQDLPDAFWRRYAVLSDERQHAAAWLDAGLARSMLEWPAPVLPAEVPFLLLLMRGKVYLRMEHAQADMGVTQHALKVFIMACESAQAAFSSRA